MLNAKHLTMNVAKSSYSIARHNDLKYLTNDNIESYLFACHTTLSHGYFVLFRLLTQIRTILYFYTQKQKWGSRCQGDQPILWAQFAV